MTSRSKKVSK